MSGDTENKVPLENQEDTVENDPPRPPADTAEPETTVPPSPTENTTADVAEDSDADVAENGDADGDGDEENDANANGDGDADADGDGDEENDDNIVFLESSQDNTPEEVLLSRLESLIYVYPEPITVRRLAKHLSVPGKRVRELITILTEQYAHRGINLSEISGGFHFHTNPANAEVVRTLTKVKPLKISRPALETLAIVAYKQPCTRSEVEDVRRVDCGGTLKFLFEKELIRVLGRKEEPGRPIIYGTSSKFLEMFNLKSLADLPSLREYTELWDEHRELVDEDEPDESKHTNTSVSSAHLQQELPIDTTDATTDTDTDDQKATDEEHETDIPNAKITEDSYSENATKQTQAEPEGTTENDAESTEAATEAINYTESAEATQGTNETKLPSSTAEETHQADDASQFAQNDSETEAHFPVEDENPIKNANEMEDNKAKHTDEEENS